MPREFFSVAEILSIGSIALPSDHSGMARLIEERGWRGDSRVSRFSPGSGRNGGTWEYHFSLLPSEVRAKLLAADISTVSPTAAPKSAKSELWQLFETLPEKAKSEAVARLARVEQVDSLSTGMARQAAVALVAAEAGISTSTLWGWLRLASGAAPADCLPALAPRYKGRTDEKPCDPRAWDFLVADFLRPEQPSFDACHRRLTAAAAAQGWAPIPSPKTLRRRLERIVPRAAQIVARRGTHTAKALFPHQTRDKTALAALEAVNADGHRFDVFVKWEDGAAGRPVMTAFQDVYSGMLLAHRIDRSENWTVVRLCLLDLVESFGVPDHAIFDNGRHFASKWLSGRTETRFRFRMKEEEPAGLLPILGCQVHFTTPYHGQAKPIERAFRDLCEEIAKHPACAGAYTGNRPDAKPENYGAKAIPIDEFRALVAQEIARHNQRPGRRSLTAKGRSLFETFRASYENAPVRRISGAQRRMLLLAAEGVKAAKSNGEIRLGDNRYWAPALVDLAGRSVVVRFDPQDLSLPLAVYSADGRFVCEAECIALTGFLDIDAAREHGRLKRLYLRNLREGLALEKRLTIDQVAALLPSPEPIQAPRPSVVRLVANGGPSPVAFGDSPNGRGDQAISSDQLARLFGESSILQFRPSPGSGLRPDSASPARSWVLPASATQDAELGNTRVQGGEAKEEGGRG